MKSSICEFQEFKAAVEKNELVYLFGTGISSALTGQRYGWYKWIVDGIHIMKDKACADMLERSLNEDSSAENMIRVVGEVLAKTKEDGVYHNWMQASFESDCITNYELEKTLRKMLVAQSVFVTTNYDRYLETATGLGSLTYEQPDEAFSMLDSRNYHSVLHIHGMYDSASGIDNIVADDEQYNTVLGNKGAQFIQNILGTRTLIFVGCGQTAEDVNISQFIRFAREYLKMDRTYYFLCQKGQVVEGLPENMVTIPYGEDYSDLPKFLEDMAQVRLTALMEQNALIGRTAYSGKQESTKSSLSKYHYAQENIPFCGREKELEELISFLQPNYASVSWWTVTGQAGAGKSRLAMELLHHLPASWFGFFLSDSFTESDIQAFKPFSNTVVVIDYVMGRESIVAGAMRKLDEVFRGTGYCLRILLLERENSKEAGSWCAKLKKAFGRFGSIWDDLYCQDFLCLDDMEIEAVEEFIGHICKQNQLPLDSKRDKYLRERYAEKFEVLRYRPLYVQLFAEAWIRNGCTLPRYDSYEELLAEVLEREQMRWLDIFDNNQQCCNAMIRLVIRAGIAGELKISDIPSYYLSDWHEVKRFIENHTFPGAQRNEETVALLGDVCQNISSTNAVICPMFPDLLKEYMFFYYRDEEGLPDVMRELWVNEAHNCSVFLRRCMTDFPENKFYFRALNTYTFSEDDLDFLIGRQEMLKKKIINENDDPVVILKIISNEQAFWRAVQIPQNSGENSEETSILKITGLKLVVDQIGGWIVYDMSPVMDAIDDMLDVPCGEAGMLLKQTFLDELIRECSEKGFADEAKELIQKQESLASIDDEFSKLLHLNNRNVEMMNLLMEADFRAASRVLDKMNDECDRKNINEARLLAHSCQNIAHISAMACEPKYIEKGFSIISEIYALYPSDVQISARYILCRSAKLQYKFMVENSISDAELAMELDNIDKKFRELSYTGNNEDDDTYAFAWGFAKTLRINLICYNETALRSLIQECESLLEKNAHQPDIVNTKLNATRALYKNVLHRKIGKAEIKDAFHFVELNSDSESLRETFFTALEESEESKNRNKYMTRPVVCGAIQDARFNPMSDGGIPEISDALCNLDADFSQPYRRTHPKVGVNEPCPCGSGKKYKKCCRGNGRFD